MSAQWRIFGLKKVIDDKSTEPPKDLEDFKKRTSFAQREIDAMMVETEKDATLYNFRVVRKIRENIGVKAADMMCIKQVF